MLNKHYALFFMICLAFGCTEEPVADTDELAVATYDEAHRPQLHFSPPTKWMNDPNGMVFFDGEYHLFYQYHPESTVWGPMHWGHAVSTDLIHWENLPIALYPDEQGYIFSGSAVVDWNNDSGFGPENGEPPLVAFFTYHDMEMEQGDSTAITYQSQAVAYSNDKGRTWTKHEGNPVIPNPGIKDFRDPKVIRDTDSDQWVMVLAAKDRVQFYGSKDLKKWRYLSDFGQDRGKHGGVWECPDLFPMFVAENGSKKWVLLSSINPEGPNGGSATQYFIGEFDGTRFRLDQEFAAHYKRNSDEGCWLDYGRDNYAGVTWSDIDEDDGRKIFLGWMSNWDYARDVPTDLWRSAMTLPRVLELKNTRIGPRIHQSFAEELTKLRENRIRPAIDGSSDSKTQLNISAGQAEFLVRAAVGEESNTRFGFEFSNKQGEIYRIGYDAEQGAYFSDRTKSRKTKFSDDFATGVHYAPKQMEGALVTMHLIVDVASAELIADDGLVALTDIFFPTEDFSKVEFFVEGGAIDMQRLDGYSLKGIWE